MTDKGLEPADAETMAAFLDRRLSGRERREFMERLDRDQVLYEVFVETVRYRESGAAEGAAVIEHPAAGRRSGWKIPVGIAALLALAVALPLLLRGGGGLAGAGLARALVDGGRLDGRLEPGWTQQGWSRTRGLTHLESETDSAFRVGVHAVDLEVALRLGRTDDARQLLAQIDYALRGIDLSDHLQVSYMEIQKQLEAGAPLERALALAATADSHSSELLDSGYGYAFGKWTEAGKLAARSGNEELLRSRTFRKMLEEVRARDWSAPVEKQLDTIATMIADRRSELDMEALARAFTALIDES